MGEHGTPPEDDRRERPAVGLEEIGTLTRRKRRMERLSLDQAAKRVGVSAATLWRLERRATAGPAGKDMPTPDVRTLGAITDWLGVAISGAGFAPAPPSHPAPGSKPESVPDVVEAHLRADPKLDTGTASLLARMFRAAYAEATNGSAADSVEADRLDGRGLPSRKDEG